MNKLVRIHTGPPPGADDLLEMIEELLLRARTGLVLGLALVEHRHGDEVAIEYTGPNSYHHLNSGAARLAHALASKQQGE
jgi:hypothetical protein